MLATNVDAPLVPVVVNDIGDCFPLKVVQSVADKYPSTKVVAFGMLKVLSADRLPPPLNGDVVDIVRVVGT